MGVLNKQIGTFTNVQRMTTSSIEDQNQAHSNIRELQRQEQHELNVRLSLDRIKSDVYIYSGF